MYRQHTFSETFNSSEKNLQGTNTLAYLTSLKVTMKKSFMPTSLFFIADASLLCCSVSDEEKIVTLTPLVTENLKNGFEKYKLKMSTLPRISSGTNLITHLRSFW
jgi:hypothetical protein